MSESVQAVCSCCKKRFPVETLHLLPDAEDHAKDLALSLLHSTPPPEALGEDAPQGKYVFSPNDLLCDDCLKIVAALSSHRKNAD